MTATGRHATLAAPGDLLGEDGALEHGPHHQMPPCRHFPECGGCQIQHLRYGAQLKLKTRIVANALQKIAGGVQASPQRDLRAVSAGSALCISPINLKGLASTHPPLEKRLEQLARVQAELGRPTG